MSNTLTDLWKTIINRKCTAFNYLWKALLWPLTRTATYWLSYKTTIITVNTIIKNIIFLIYGLKRTTYTNLIVKIILTDNQNNNLNINLILNNSSFFETERWNIVIIIICFLPLGCIPRELVPGWTPSIHNQ